VRGYASTVDSFKREFLACDAAIRAHLEMGEHVVAVGRCADITEIGGVDDGGAARTYLMITDRRLRWVESYDLATETSIKLSDITSFSERMLAHRWAILLRHPSVRYRRLRPGRTLPASAAAILRADGRLRDEPGPITYTEFAFSRRDTAAARALRDALASGAGA
jgi:hypothetical protein